MTAEPRVRVRDPEVDLADLRLFVVVAEELHFGRAAARLHLSQPGVSKHLKVLREAGLVEVRPEGKRRWYGLRAEPLAEVAGWLEPYRRHWSDRLDALEQHLEENPT